LKALKKTSMKTKVYFHGNCADGTLAAAVFDLLMRDRSCASTVTYEKFVYNTTEIMAEPDVDTLVFVDCNVTKEAILKVKEGRESLIVKVFDHHEGSEWVRHTWEVDGLHDPRYSGAALVMFASMAPKILSIGLHVGLPIFTATADLLSRVAPLVEAISKYDTWSPDKSASDTAISKALHFRYCDQPELLARHIIEKPRLFKELQIMGETLVAQEAQIIENMSKNRHIVVIGDCACPLIMTGGSETPFLNEALHAIASKEEGVACGAYLDFNKRLKLSFRSVAEGKALTLAKELGGGGHPNAAGVKLSVDDSKKFMEKILAIF